MGTWAALKTERTGLKTSSSSAPTQTASCHKALVSLFIVWNAAAILFTNTSAAWVPWGVQRIFLPYARFTRVMQRWSLFCPEPRRYVSSYYFVATYKDGSVRRWQRPFPPNWGYLARLHAANWQKFDSASHHMEDRQLWPDLARWATRELFSDEGVPSRIQLFQYVAKTPPPNEGGNVQPDAKDFHFNERLIFTYIPEKGSFGDSQSR